MYISQDVKKFIRITINGKSVQKAGSIATLNGNAALLTYKIFSHVIVVM